jgi:hypothetical protein
MRPVAAFTIVLAAAGVSTVAAPRSAWAQEPVVIEPPASAPAATLTPADLLASADAAVEAGNLQSAAVFYDRLVREHAAAPEAAEARRALRIIAASRAAQGQLVPALRPPGAPDGTVGVVVRREPFSLNTQERLRLTTWEKLDFGTTAFLYGMSVGFSFALASDETAGGGIGVAPVAIGALAYTIGAVAYLQSGEPDRGDLPLALAITSFLPTTVLLVANVASDNPDERNVALMTAGAGLLSVPIAIVAARKMDLDPGDTQLVRDAGFWGLVLGTTGMLAFGGETVTYPGGYTVEQGPSDRKVFTSSLLGLYGALGLGIAAAANSEVSLERVRVSTWGGYGGAVIGLLLGVGAADDDADVWKGITIGSAAGLIITFIATSSLDGIPADETTVSVRRKPPRFTPTLLPVAGVDGRSHPALGITGLTF